MAMNGRPTIFEQTTSSDSPLPSIPNLSPHTSSSSDSFDSSRPNSQGSSATSRSVSPSPIPKSIPVIDSQESIELPALPSNPPPPPPLDNIIASHLHRQNNPPRSVPPAPAVSPRTEHKAAWPSRLGSLVPRRNWYANALGTIGLGLSLIGMIIFGERTYKLAVWSAWNDALDTCGQLNSTGIILGSNCQKLLSNNTADVTFPPYSHWKRTLNATVQAGSRFLKESFTKRSTLLTDRPGNDTINTTFNFSSAAIVLSSTVIMGGLSLIVFRHYWRTEEVFTSPVRSDWQFTRHHQEGPETISGEGYRMIRCNPEDDHPLGQLREGIRKSQPSAVENPTGQPTWQSHNASEDTFNGPWKDTKWGPSKVSLSNDVSDERRENLIELETKGPNKTFFDPDTGEFIHLTPWKSAGDEEVHGLKPDGKGSTKRALIQMTLGGAGWAGGKNIDDQLAEELQANSKGVEKKDSGPPKAGDCITGPMDFITTVNEKDKDEVDPKVTEFLLHKPWYASIKPDTDVDADAYEGSNIEGAGLEQKSASASKSDKEQDDADFWIPQTTADGQLFYFNTLTGVSILEHPRSSFKLTDLSSDWETKAMDSSQLPYVDREDTYDLVAVTRKLARIGDDEGGDIDATLAKLEGRYPKSQVGSSEAQSRMKPSLEEQWQTILAESEKKRAAGLEYGRSSNYLDDKSVISISVERAEQAKAVEGRKLDLTDNVGAEASDDESIISSNVKRAEQAEAVHAEMQKFARVEAKRNRWQRFRSIGRLFGR